MAAPQNSTLQVYRLRTNETEHQGLYYRDNRFSFNSLLGDTSELWVLNSNKLMNLKSGQFFGGVSGVATMTSSSTATVLTFPSSSSSGKYYIKGPNNYYLNWVSPQLIWEATARTSWYFERLLQFTGIPTYGTDYFSEKCGSTTGGTFSSDWSNKIRALYKKVFSTTSCTDSKAFINLYGAMYSNDASIPSGYRGKIHTGIDMNYSDLRSVYSPIIGARITSVKATASGYGVVTVAYNSSINFLFAHMEIDTAKIKVGDLTSASIPLGKQSTVGLPNGSKSHLHFEVTSATSIAPLPSGSWESIGRTYFPYSYLSIT